MVPMISAIRCSFCRMLAASWSGGECGVVLLARERLIAIRWRLQDTIISMSSNFPLMATFQHVVLLVHALGPHS